MLIEPQHQTALLDVAISLSMDVAAPSLKGGDLNPREGGTLLKFIGALQRCVDSSHKGSVPPNRMEALAKAWGDVPLFLRLKMAETAAENGCHDELGELVGGFPKPAPTKPKRRRQPKPMF